MARHSWLWPSHTRGGRSEWLLDDGGTISGFWLAEMAGWCVGASMAPAAHVGCNSSASAANKAPATAISSRGSLARMKVGVLQGVVAEVVLHWAT